MSEPRSASDPWNPLGVVHVYGQESHHGEAYVVGDGRGLGLLRQAIDQATVDGHGRAEVFAADGEGYALHVVHRLVGMDRLQLPYTRHLDERRQQPSWRRLRPPHSLVPQVEGDEVLDDDAWFEWEGRLEAAGQVLTFREGDAWVAAWRVYDVVAQGKDEEAAVDALYRTIAATVLFDCHDGRAPFSSTPRPSEDLLARWTRAHAASHLHGRGDGGGSR